MDKYVRSWNPSENWRIKPQGYSYNNNNNWRLIPQWYPYYGKNNTFTNNNKNKDGTVGYRQYASGWQQLIDNHRTYRNFRKYYNVKYWKNTFDEQKGIERMIFFLIINHHYNNNKKSLFLKKRQLPRLINVVVVIIDIQKLFQNWRHCHCYCYRHLYRLLFYLYPMRVVLKCSLYHPMTTIYLLQL